MEEEISLVERLPQPSPTAKPEGVQKPISMIYCTGKSLLKEADAYGTSFFKFQPHKTYRIVVTTLAIENPKLLQSSTFVGVGQPVTIKLDAFPYSRYGYVTGVVKSVSFDAIEDKVLGLVFSTVIGINQDYLMVNDQKVPFSAGMRVTAEIKTGERRVISYLLSPLKETISESMRER